MDQNNSQQPQHHQPGIDEQQTGFMVGAVLGALVGGAAALLLTPKSGKEMREIVKKYSKELESEAYELAKESRGVATSFKSVLEDGANEVIEQAPERLEQAGYQAQQLAEDLSHRFESARDVVSELAEAFRSGWEEYGEEHPDDEFTSAAPALFADEHEDSEPQTVKSEIEESAEAEKDSSQYAAPLQSRRRGQVSGAYSMHTQHEEKPADEAVTKASVEEKKPAPKAESKPEPKTEKESKPKYETRVLEKPTQVKSSGVDVKLTETKAKADKAEEKPRKKLLFRRSK